MLSGQCNFACRVSYDRVLQSFLQHLDESDSQRVKEIIDRALKDAEWILTKVSPTYCINYLNFRSCSYFYILIFFCFLFFSMLLKRHE